jgi:hypothetical protein
VPEAVELVVAERLRAGQRQGPVPVRAPLARQTLDRQEQVPQASAVCPPGPANAGGLNNSGNDPSGAGNSAKSPDAPGMRTPGTNAAGTANSSGPSSGNTAAPQGSTTVGTAGNRAGGTSSGKIDGTVTSGGPDRPGDAEVRAEDAKVDQKIKSICKGC